MGEAGKRVFYDNPTPSGSGSGCSGSSAMRCNTELCAGAADGGWSSWYACSQDCEYLLRLVFTVSRHALVHEQAEAARKYARAPTPRLLVAPIVWVPHRSLVIPMIALSQEAVSVVSTQLHSALGSLWFPANCPVVCGTGIQTRSCNNPAPADGGPVCTGSSSQTCNTHACTSPVNGGWSAWTS